MLPVGVDCLRNVILLLLELLLDWPAETEQAQEHQLLVLMLDDASDVDGTWI